jgi:methionyl-tRNA synthetase
MNISLQIAAGLSALAEPFLPFSADKLRKMLNMKEIYWQEAGKRDLLPAGHLLNKAELLFEKIEDQSISKQIDKLMETKKENEQNAQVPDAKPEIAFDDFMKMDIRIGEILTAEPVPKSNKLLKFTVDTGIDQRTILSGIAKFFQPEEMIGKKVPVLVNLAPRKIMGVESQGMILFAENFDGTLKALNLSDDTDNGAGVS